MKRLHARGSWSRWLHQKLGLVAWYKYVSRYGESYVWPFIWLMVVLGIFTLLFPLAGLDSGGKTPQSVVTVATEQGPPGTATAELSYKRFSDFVNAYPGRRAGRTAFFGHSLMSTLYVAGFQRDLAYVPRYPWGRALALLEVLLTSSLIALFLLAIRRQFRR